MMCDGAGIQELSGEPCFLVQCVDHRDESKLPVSGVLSAEGAANEAVNVLELLGSSSTLCPKPVTLSTFQSMAEQPII
jgi:hypothetical protein